METQTALRDRSREGCATGLSQHGPGPLQPEALPCGDANSCLSRGAPKWRQQILRSGWQHPGHTRWPDCVPPKPADPQGDTSIIPWPERAGLEQEAWRWNPIWPDSRGYSAWGQECTWVSGVWQGCGRHPPLKNHAGPCAHAHMHTHLHACMETDAACAGNSEAQKDAEGPPQALSPSWGTSATK